MPLDAVCLTGVVRELREALLDLRIEKVQQPARDQVILTLRGNRRLLLCAGASQARVHLTALGRENPAQPPMFCMLLRKHLTGGRLTAIDQPPAERVVILTVSMVDELGEPGRRRLVAECMGRRSNLILLDGEDRTRLAEAFSAWQETVRGENGRGFTPWMLTKGGTPADFSYMPIRQYGSAMEGTPWDSFSQMLDAFYEKREQAERVRQRGADLQRAAANARDRAVRKLALQEKEYAKTQDRDRLRVFGELITANLYRMERGQSVLRAQNYYEPDCPEVEVPLDHLLTPQQNAARYFKQYSKAKTAERYLTQQMALARRERDWLESVLDELSRAESEQDFADIRRELREAGHLKGAAPGKKEPRRGHSRPRSFRSSGGFRILVGRSNSQNDQITREAFKSDYWFHTQRIHGAHVILCAEGRQPEAQDLTEAALLAAWFSQGREGGQVAVDYTQVKNVKKPAGARPGMVVYDPYQTAYVTPDEALVKALEEKRPAAGAEK